MITPDKQQDQDNLILLIPEQERICLDAYLFNESNKISAYKVCKGITSGDDAMLNSRANSWLSNRTSKAYLQKVKNITIKLSESQNLEENDSTMLDKAAIIEQISILIAKTTDIKLKSDLLMKLNELKGYKKDTTKADEQQIRYYLPQRCETCDYKADYQAHNKL